MPHLNNKISHRLAGVLGLLLLTTLAIVGMALWQMGVMRTLSAEVSNNWLPSVETVNQMNANTGELRVAEFQQVLNTDSTRVAALEKTMAQIQAEFEAHHKTYVALISSPEEHKLHDAFDAQWKHYLQFHAQIVELSRKNEQAQARELLEGDAQRTFEAMSKVLDQLVELNQTGARSAAEASESAYLMARNAMVIAAALGLAMAVTAGLWLMRSITGPLQQALQAAHRVADGDLSCVIEHQSQDESGQVLQALQQMQTSLEGVVTKVRDNADSVATASQQIANASQDLSSRTEEQASALEETAATMDELAATVRTNTENAQQADQLARSASAIAVQGGEVVGKVVTTMQNINASSRKISDIIGVIDGIAFQTNILALNAAVEAARAGEQGRGFAVVASEVRSLAQRSAEAAKEIKTLISRSVEQVSHGTDLVDQAGKTMGEIVGSIRRVSDIVTEITTATQEQSLGIQQVGQAISQLDQTTQQNAAMVEESAAAAETLKDQAMQLVQTVAVFRLSGTPSTRASAMPAAPRQTAPQTRAATMPAPRPTFRSAPAHTAVQTSAGTPAAAEPVSDDWAKF
ncbi:MCP four helix bundle domain-containing protein [Sphaerotilus montanus]|uniref:Methyl-accepting chemotaxis protein n=1 Tax=Sphaerotilus montanus TaxID=522889 RepID=A0A7Y9UDT1_9BURK|nr:methyl-accepting chemotaxis protein [Sphaerotilus montanus]NYG34904.1 methyl-accepting chemotaxis protein [Sphaerotilus montanus]NZD55500.1 MCP four helix bundle domain-containing protein [Sphaerotilus montanus]